MLSRLALTLVLLALVSPAVAQERDALYAMVDGQLSVVDPSFAAHTPFPEFGVHGGLAFGGDGGLWIGGGRSILEDDLLLFDPDSAEQLGSTDLCLAPYAFNVNALGVQPGTGEVFAVGSTFHRHGFLDDHLVTIDLGGSASCQLESLLDASFFGYLSSLAFAPDGVLYVAADSYFGSAELWTVDPESGATLTTVALSQSVTGLVVRPSDGALLGAANGALHQVDPATGVLNPLGPPLGQRISDLAYRRVLAETGCAGSVPVFGTTDVASPSATTWRCPFPPGEIAAGGCVVLVWPPVRSPSPLAAPIGCGTPEAPCALFSSDPMLAMLPVAGAGLNVALPPGLPPGPILGIQCACISVTLSPQPCAWVSADAIVRIVP